MLINDLPYIMIRSLVCTALIELTVGLILGVRNKKDMINIVLVNVITNPLVVVLPVYFNIKYGILERNICLYILEFATVLVEWFIYKKVLKFRKISPLVFSIVLNVLSYFIGEIINYL